MPCVQITINYWDEIKNLPLPANKLDTLNDIDVLFGCDYFFSVIREGKFIKDDNLLLRNAVFGWVICSGCTIDGSISVRRLSQSVTKQDFNKTLRLFSEYENLKSSEPCLTIKD